MKAWEDGHLLYQHELPSQKWSFPTNRRTNELRCKVPLVSDLILQTDPDWEIASLGRVGSTGVCRYLEARKKNEKEDLFGQPNLGDYIILYYDMPMIHDVFPYI